MSQARGIREIIDLRDFELGLLEGRALRECTHNTTPNSTESIDSKTEFFYQGISSVYHGAEARKGTRACQSPSQEAFFLESERVSTYSRPMEATWPQWISYSSFGLFVFVLVASAIALSVPLSLNKTRVLCVSGVSAVLILAVNCGVLYYWHHYFRI